MSWAKESALEALASDGPAVGQKVRHYKGGFYEVVGCGIIEDTLTPVVMYRGHDGIVWVRTLANFRGKVRVGDDYVERFQDGTS